MADTEARRIVRSSKLGGITEAAAEEIRDLYRDEVALQLGRDCMKLGLLPFLTKLVGETNVDILFERHVEGR